MHRVFGMRPSFVLAAILAATSVGRSSCLAGSAVTVGANIPARQRVALEEIDHSAWDSLLQKYVHAAGMVDYGSWKSAAVDEAALDNYLRRLSMASFDSRTDRNAQLAFWINAYNAVTVKGILREYPTTSIRNHTARLYGYNIWKDLLLPVNGRSYSLEETEHEVLRKMDEPRIHLAIVCASRSCPPLRREAYTADKLNEQLTDNAKTFFANSANFRHDRTRRQFYLSSIFKWFGEDFGADQAAQLKTIAPYLPTREAYKAAIANAVSISYLSYDWGLNDQAIARTARR